MGSRKALLIRRLLQSIKFELNLSESVSEVELRVDMPDMYLDGEWTWKDNCKNGTHAAGIQLEVSAL